MRAWEPPAETEQLLAIVAGSRQASEDFASTLAGTMSVPDFFDPSNIARYLSAAA